MSMENVFQALATKIGTLEVSATIAAENFRVSEEDRDSLRTQLEQKEADLKTLGEELGELRTQVDKFTSPSVETEGGSEDEDTPGD